MSGQNRKVVLLTVALLILPLTLRSIYTFTRNLLLRKTAHAAAIQSVRPYTLYLTEVIRRSSDRTVEGSISTKSILALRSDGARSEGHDLTPGTRWEYKYRILNLADGTSIKAWDSQSTGKSIQAYQ